MKDVWMEPEREPNYKKINKKKIGIITVLILAIVLAIVTIGVYYTNQQTRGWIDKYIFRKEILQDKATTIDLKEEQNAISMETQELKKSH